MKIPSEDFHFKRIKATIEGEKGNFAGVVRKSSGLPDGYGVFITDVWTHCGKVKDGDFVEGRNVIVNEEDKILILSNLKALADGSFLEKSERFSEQGVERYLLLNGEKIAKIIARLNIWHDAENWFSMRPSA